MDHQHHLSYLQQVGDSHSDSATTSCASQSDTIASCEDLVWSVQQKMNTDTGKHKIIRICTTCKKDGLWPTCQKSHHERSICTWWE